MSDAGSVIAMNLAWPAKQPVHQISKAKSKQIQNSIGASTVAPLPGQLFQGRFEREIV
jgi:hypothetical protein